VTTSEIAASVQAIAGCLTFLSALVAVWATLSAPQRAAKFAESIRRQSELEDFSRREKMHILTTLMQKRADIACEASVSSINLIPVVFRSNRDVLSAHDHFMQSVNVKPFSQDAMKERFLVIIESIVKTLKLSEEISYKEIREFYDPQVLAQARALEQIAVKENFDAKFGKPAN
jgi:hypothetical protein